MYAIVIDGSKQIKVEEGQVLDIDYRNVPAGESITFDRVLAMAATAPVRRASANRPWLAPR